ncbi:MAG: pyrroline-5-carboxylate reductase [Atopobiaceae bacterium]|jgi:pyrroline-5-carboxylate reductase|nr:pyrroline-5-carboxylate reductase [Atopobiaceae bacterium]
MPNVDAKVAVIGAGSMGGAIASGLVSSGTCDPKAVLLCDPSEQRLEGFSTRFGMSTFRSNAEALAQGPDVTVLAVKPQVLPGVLESLADSVAGSLVISIAAGVTLSTLEAALPGARVIRTMPNLPVSVRSGAIAIAPGTAATADDVALAQTLFSALGSVAVMREDQLDVECAVASCAPAYFALMVDALTRAGILEGLGASEGRSLVESTMLGTARMLLESGEHPRAYMERVTSPGGTTAAALAELEPALVEGAYAAVSAALRRGDELAEAAK